MSWAFQPLLPAAELSAVVASVDDPAPLPHLGLLGGFSPVSTGAYTLTAESASYALTGTAAVWQRRVSAATGSYALSGTVNSLRAGRRVIADSGTYSLTGTAAALQALRRLVADSGSYALTGTTDALRAARQLVAESGEYLLDGTIVELTAAGAYFLTAEAGEYLLTGSDSELTGGTVVVETTPIAQSTGGWLSLDDKRVIQIRHDDAEIMEIVTAILKRVA